MMRLSEFVNFAKFLCSKNDRDNWSTLYIEKTLWYNVTLKIRLKGVRDGMKGKFDFAAGHDPPLLGGCAKIKTWEKPMETIRRKVSRIFTAK